MPLKNAKPPERRHELLELQHPIQGTELHEVLFVLAPRAGDMRLLPMPAPTEDKDGNPLPPAKTLVGDMHPFAAKICGLLLSEFEKLELVDYAAVMALVGKMVESVPQIGASAAPGSPASSTSGATSS